MDRLAAMSADYFRNEAGAALLRIARQKLREKANGSDCAALRDFIAGLDEHFGSGAIRAVAVNAEPAKPGSSRKRNPSCGSSRGGKGN